MDLSGQWQCVFTAGKTALSVPIRSRLAVSTAEAAIDAAVADVGITRVVAYQLAARCRERVQGQSADLESPT